MDRKQVLLDVQDLTVGFRKGDGVSTAVEGVSFSLHRGELLALVGESGSGKTVTSLALMGLLPEATAVCQGGRVMFGGLDLLSLSPEERRKVLGKRIAMIFQEPMTALNPVLSIGWQLSEILIEHENMSQREAHERAVELLEEVGIPGARARYGDYPHQLSGGMRQRVMIAMALACRPELLIADEPTTALDVTVQAQIMELLNELRHRLGTAVLFVTHNLALVKEQADRVAVMVSGRIVEVGYASALFASPSHPYTQLLLKSIPRVGSRGKVLSSIEGTVGLREDRSGCVFDSRCPYAQSDCRCGTIPMRELSAGHWVWCHHVCEQGSSSCDIGAAESMKQEEDGSALLRVDGLKVWFPVRSGFLNRVTGRVRAVDGVSFELHAGETLALVGESGCGKTTVGKALVRLVDPTDGHIAWNDGKAMESLRGRELASCRRRIQMVFQDPFSSLDPRLMIRESLLEGMNGVVEDGQLERLMERVGLPVDALNRYPHQFSGGQRQRIGLARALSVQPEIIVCDECTSALDVSVQAQILNLLRELQVELGVSYVFITHDLSVVSYFADRVAVMYLGRIVEEGTAEDVFRHPCHPYTRALLSAAPSLEEGDSLPKIRLDGDVPSPLSPPTGCHFHPRCPSCTSCCHSGEPPRREVGNGHWYTCWHGVSEGER